MEISRLNLGAASIAWKNLVFSCESTNTARVANGIVTISVLGIGAFIASSTKLARTGEVAIGPGYGTVP